MFPIIPYNLSSRPVYYPEPEICNNVSKLTNVVAVCDIPKDTYSKEINYEDLCGKMENTNIQLEVILNHQNEIELKTKNNLRKYHWIKAIRLADDCHNYNAKLCFKSSTGECSKSNFIVQITKFIKSGQELLLWFSEDILAHLQMAFLTPANIQDQKKYVCHRCSTTFEYPNPLKLHLTLECGKQQISVLWDRLSKLSNTSTNESSKSTFGFQLLKSQTKEMFSILNLSKSSSDKTTELTKHLPLTSQTIEIQRPVSEPPTLHSSAFKPYFKKSTQNNNSIRLSQSVSNFTNLPPILPINYHPQTTTNDSQSYQNLIDFNHAAQMETIVSNLGKSKQGHLCIYCGKCYSRKYGLKIHIRTHTGYKPLKCKYCLRPFGDPSNLNKHVRLHAEGDTPYKCELCGKILVRRRDLERHLKSRHFGEIQLGEKVDDINNSSSDQSDD